MATAEEVVARMTSLVDEANAVTGQNDGTVADAMRTLAAGYGAGGGSSDASCMVFKYDATSKQFIYGEQRYFPLQFANLVPGICSNKNIVVMHSRTAYILYSVLQRDGWTSVFYSVYMDEQDASPIRYRTISVNTNSDEVIFNTELITIPAPINNAPYICLLADLGEGLKVYNDSGTEALDAAAILSILGEKPVYLFEMQEGDMVAYTLRNVAEGEMQFQKVDTTGNGMSRTVVTITDTVTKEEVITDIPDIPTPTAEDEGKVLAVADGAAVWQGEGKYELIEDITLEETVSSWRRTQEPDGTDYNFAKMLVLVTVPGATAFNGSYVFMSGTDNVIACGVSAAAGKTNVYFEIKKESGYWRLSGNPYGGSGNNMPNSIMEIPAELVEASTETYTAITRIQAWGTHEATTNIKIYGVRA